MNAVDILPRLRAFNQDTWIRIAVPVGPGGGGGHRLLPVLSAHQQGLGEDVVDHDRGGLELFTPHWDDQQPWSVATLTIADIVRRIALHRDEANVRVAVPYEPPPEGGRLHRGPHWRILSIETIGFANEPAAADGQLAVEIITEPWESINIIVRSDPPAE